MSKPESNDAAERASGSLERMVGAIRDLLDHPFPHDLMKLRRRVASEYGGDEASAKAEMEEWCSQELCDRELGAYIEARKAGNAIIAEYGPNGRGERPGIEEYHCVACREVIERPHYCERCSM